MGWLNWVLKETEEAESPEQYCYWAALTAISAVAKKNVYLDKFFYKLYPNIFVFLVGRSGLRKGFPIWLAENLVREVNNTRLITGRNSIEGVIKTLSTAQSSENGSVNKDAIGFLVSGEFASFLLQNPEALTILTDLYDTHARSKWDNTLKVSGVESLNNVCLTMLGATNETHFKDSVPNNAIGGGFIARTFIVYADKKKRSNDLTVEPENRINMQELSEPLRRIASLKGAFQYTDAGRLFYQSWYKDYDRMVMSNHQDNTGTLERFHDQILKVAMLISLSKRSDLMIDDVDIAEALEHSQACLSGLKRVVMGAGMSPFAPQTAIILKELLSRPQNEISRSRLLQKYWGELDSIDLDRIVETMIQSKAIVQFRRGKDIIYKMEQSKVEQYMEYKLKEEK